MLVVWGQYIDHDMDLTPQSLSTSTFQGLTDCSQTCENEPPCYPMLVPENDPRIEGVRCLPFFRSAAVCGTGDTSSLFNRLLPREQINAATSFIDASTVRLCCHPYYSLYPSFSSGGASSFNEGARRYQK